MSWFIIYCNVRVYIPKWFNVSAKLQCISRSRRDTGVLIGSDLSHGHEGLDHIIGDARSALLELENHGHKNIDKFLLDL